MWKLLNFFLQVLYNLSLDSEDDEIQILLKIDDKTYQDQVNYFLN